MCLLISINALRVCVQGPSDLVVVDKAPIWPETQLTTSSARDLAKVETVYMCPY